MIMFVDLFEQIQNTLFVFEDFGLFGKDVQKLSEGFHGVRPVSFQFNDPHELLVLNDARDEKEHDQEKY